MIAPARHGGPARLRRVLAALAVAGAVLAAGSVADAAPSPTAITGDPHSPAVIDTANVALAAHDVFSYVQTPDSFVAYLGARNATADAVAYELGLDPLVLRDAWARADLPHQKAVLAALTQIGMPYVGYESDPAVGFDCSGLTSWAWSRAGVTLPRQSGAQIEAARAVDQSEALAGDIAQYPGHVMMYLGTGDAIVHAVNSGRDIAIDVLRREVRFGDVTG